MGYPTINELQFIYDNFSQRERVLLVSLLKEEKENIEAFKNQNEWASQRIKIINSILKSLGENITKEEE